MGDQMGKTCDDYCSAYRDNCDSGSGYGVYQEVSTSEGMPGAEAGRQECVADCKYFSSVYDGDLCCRLTEVAQGTGSPADQHCDHANFFQGGPFCPQVVRDTTCSTGTDSGKTCSDFCAAYDDKCSGIGYLGVDDCLFNCKVQSITDGTLCCRLSEVAQGSGENQHCKNAYQGRGGSCPAEP